MEQVKTNKELTDDYRTVCKMITDIKEHDFDRIEKNMLGYIKEVYTKINSMDKILEEMEKRLQQLEVTNVQTPMPRM